MPKDLTGQQFGRLTVLEKADVFLYGTDRWLCKCECGNMAVYTSTQLIGKHRVSCGCANGSKVYAGLTKKRLATQKEYKKMIQHCESGEENKYRDETYKGVIVCSEWYDDFDSFYRWSLDSGFEEGMKLFRLDGSKDFEPDNCYWQTEAANA